MIVMMQNQTCLDSQMNFNNEVMSRLSEISQRLNTINDQMKKIQPSCPCAPPGLLPSEIATLDQRMTRLETLYVCSPNPEVDTVLEAMLKQKTTSIVCNNESESTSLSELASTELYQVSTEVFDLYADESKAVATQTDVTTSNEEASTCMSKGVQTSPFKKPRRNRCHGRATQTSPHQKSCFADGEWEPIGMTTSIAPKYRSQCCGPDLGTLDEIDLLPAVLAGGYVTGQVVQTNIPLRLDSGVLLPSLSTGRILRQHEHQPSCLWVFFEKSDDGNLVSVASASLARVT